MKIKLTNPMTGNSSTEDVSCTTDHSLSSYGQPVLVGKNGLIDYDNWILQNCRVVEISDEEKPLLDKWLSMLDIFQS